MTLINEVLEQALAGIPLETLWRQIQQAQLTLFKPLAQLQPLLGIHAAVQAGRCNTAARELRHLVLHQGHQR